MQFYKNYDNRILWIDDEITEMTLEYAKMIMQWNFEDKQNAIPVEDRKHNQNNFLQSWWGFGGK